MKPSKLHQQINEIAGILREKAHQRSRFLVVSHFDADGMCGTGILLKALGRLGVKCSRHIIGKLTDLVINEVSSAPFDVVIFVDIGSPMIDRIIDSFRDKRSKTAIVLDHHPPLPQAPPPPENVAHLNPWVTGVNGSREVSCGSLAYLVAKEVSEENVDLSPLGVVASVSELQDVEGKLGGLNRLVLEDGVNHKLIRIDHDLRLLGRQTYTLFDMLYLSHPPLPGIVANREACLKILRGAGVDPSSRWLELSPSEKKRVEEAVIAEASKYWPEKVIKTLVGEMYTFVEEGEGTMTRDAKEFGFLLNACGRQGEVDLGIAICMGRRGEVYEKAVEIFERDRSFIFAGLEHATQYWQEMSSIRFYTLPESIPAAMLGTINAMIVTGRLSPDKPVVGLARSGYRVRVSAHCQRELTEEGVDLGEALRRVAYGLGGFGGGHNDAGGAEIPLGKEEEFLKRFDEEIALQVRK